MMYCTPSGNSEGEAGDEGAGRDDVEARDEGTSGDEGGDGDEGISETRTRLRPVGDEDEVEASRRGGRGQATCIGAKDEGEVGC